MGKSSAKSKAKAMFLQNRDITADELWFDLDEEVLETTCEKYLIEFKQLYPKNRDEAPTTISMKRLEAELAFQLDNNPNNSVVKSCIDFLKLKQMSVDTSDEIDMEVFVKKGTDLLN